MKHFTSQFILKMSILFKLLVLLAIIAVVSADYKPSCRRWCDNGRRPQCAREIKKNCLREFRNRCQLLQVQCLEPKRYVAVGGEWEGCAGRGKICHRGRYVL